MCRLILLMLLTLSSACGVDAVKSEFYRAEIKYLHQEGNRAYKSGDYEGATDYFDAILALQPGYRPAHIQLGHLALARGEGEQAVAVYEQLIKEEPGSYDELEPYLAYAMTIPVHSDEASRGVETASINTSEDAGSALQSTRQTSVPTSDAGDIPLSVAPGMKRVNKQDELVAILKDSPVLDLSDLARFIGQLADMQSWIKEQHKVTTPRHKIISSSLVETFETVAFKGCDDCLIFAALWFGEFATAKQWPLMSAAIERTGNTQLRNTLIYKLGLSYENAGQHIHAVNTYLKNPADPRIVKRLQQR